MADNPPTKLLHVGTYVTNGEKLFEVVSVNVEGRETQLANCKSGFTLIVSWADLYEYYTFVEPKVEHDFSTS